MKIKNIEVNFDFFDADDAERFENAAKVVVKQCEEKKQENLSYSEAIRQECIVIEDFFDKVFGEGTSQKLFEGKKNLVEHIKTFEDIVKAKQEKRKDLQNTFDRYMPNREQRRNNKFNRNKR